MTSLYEPTLEEKKELINKLRQMNPLLALLLSPDLDQEEQQEEFTPNEITNNSKENVLHLKPEAEIRQDEINKAYATYNYQGTQANRFKAIKEAAKEFAQMIEGFCPESEEKTIANQKLQEVVMWAIASIERNE